MATTKTSTTGRKTTRKTTTSTKKKTASDTSAAALEPTSIKAADDDMAPVLEDVQDTGDGGVEAARKNELIELAVARSGVKKRDAKPAIEAALAIMGEMVSEGRELNLKGFGKFKVKRTVDAQNGTVVHARLRQPQVSEPAVPMPSVSPAE
ncbi:HU family DNA-binding protein [Thalassococcus lentus]|uniref:HU family DNA-binding protein n=1 Tax=Thalassococcus lentus TaxID=1210524 RepID=A0ABT4XXH3_9RHOB|nr:HU family DNA-binding protein [Thalassococcus lentus]MDA7426633.1 HU family DNA-binding protein [Thalassococcus lentus]